MLKVVLFLSLVVALAQGYFMQIKDTLIFNQTEVDLNSLLTIYEPRPGFAVLNGTAYFAYNSLYEYSRLTTAQGEVAWTADGAGTPQGGSCIVVSDNGDLYVFGGSASPSGLGLDQALVLPYGTNEFITLPPMTFSRQHHRCAFDKPTRRIYVVGSDLGNGTMLTSAEYYSIDNGNWTMIADYPYERAGFGFVSAHDGWMYVFGGRTSLGVATQELMRYNINGNSWSVASSAIIDEVADFGYWYDSDTNIVGLFGGPQNSCQFFDVSNSSDITAFTLACEGLAPIMNYSLSAVIGSDVYLFNSDGLVFVSRCALFTKCPYGCNDLDGSCLAPPTAVSPVNAPVTAQQPQPTPVSATPFSGCGQCTGDTPLCIPDRGVCVGNRVVPILQCIDTLESGPTVAYFSYDRTDLNSAAPEVLTITAGSTNNLVKPSGTPNSDFTRGRSIFYPIASFKAQYAANTNVEWFIDGYVLSFSSSGSGLACPKNVTFAVRVSNVTADQTFIDQLRLVLADTMGINIDQITAQSFSTKRNSDLEKEISVVVSPSSEPTAPSPSETVSNFIKNETAIQQVQTQIPEVKEVTGKPLPTEISGNVVPSTSPMPQPTPNVVPQTKVSGATLSFEISSAVFLAITALYFSIL